MKAMLVNLLQSRVAGYLSAVLGIAAVTAIFAPFHDQLRDTTVALALVLVVLFIATLWGRGPGMVASVLGMLCFKFFFLHPLHTLTLADPQHWTALAAFIITASTVGHLSVTAKRRTAEAEAERKAARLASLYNRSLIEASLDPLVTVGPDGKLMHAALRIGDSVLMLTDECPEMGGFSPHHFNGSPVTIHLSVADADAAFARATGAGATPLMPVCEMFWGARYGVFKDPYGHTWSVATQVKEMSPEDLQAAAKACAEHAGAAAA